MLKFLHVQTICLHEHGSGDGNGNWLVHYFGPDLNISLAVGCIAMRFGTGIQGLQRMNANDLSDPLTLPLLLAAD